MKVEELEVSVAVRNFLKADGLVDTRDLIGRSLRQVAATPNVGRSKLTELCRAINEHDPDVMIEPVSVGGRDAFPVDSDNRFVRRPSPRLIGGTFVGSLDLPLELRRELAGRGFRSAEDLTRFADDLGNSYAPIHQLVAALAKKLVAG